MQMVKIGIRDIILDTGKMNRRALTSQNAMPLALLVMVADQRADDAQRIVLVKHRTSILFVPGTEQLDDLRDVGVDGTALPAHGLLTMQAAAGFVYHMDGHRNFSLCFSQSTNLNRFRPTSGEYSRSTVPSILCRINSPVRLTTARLRCPAWQMPSVTLPTTMWMCR